MKNIEVHLNSFASRCFRDVADRDYISARMCYRAGLISQFHWSSLQAFEKYFKAILLYNRIKAKNIGHDLAQAQKHAQKAPFEIKLSGTSQKFLEHLNDYGRFRYLEASHFIYGPKLVELDKAVWELRRYCRVMDYQLPIPHKAPKPMLELEIQRNEAAEKPTAGVPHSWRSLRGNPQKEGPSRKGSPHLAERLLWSFSSQARNGPDPSLRREFTAIPVSADTRPRP